MTKFEPKESDRRLVELCAMGGITQAEIAKAVGVSEPTLRKYFREELDVAYVRANAKVVQSAFEQAVSGKSAAMTIFWLKARMGWTEKGPKEEGKAAQPDEDGDDVLGEIDRRIAEAIASKAKYTLGV